MKFIMNYAVSAGAHPKLRVIATAIFTFSSLVSLSRVNCLDHLCHPLHGKVKRKIIAFNGKSSLKRSPGLKYISSVFVGNYNENSKAERREKTLSRLHLT